MSLIRRLRTGAATEFSSQTILFTQKIKVWSRKAEYCVHKNITGSCLERIKYSLPLHIF